ncbi:MAG TPA: SIMPL domain-containing protein, partial [Pyrinomonadaceae bacterium]|nr:SIMPL domain-containing protein [Pyrinomonadaceae bacterium]
MRIALLPIFAAIVTPLTAQQPAINSTGEPVPQIVTSARGEVRVVPDRATIQISVQTRANTAATAASENATKQKAVFDALRALGLESDQLSTINYNVYPEQKYEP